MRAAKNERVRRRLLQEAVADNLDTIRGVPPRMRRSAPRRDGAIRPWLMGLSLLTLGGFSYLALRAQPDTELRPPVMLASVLPRIANPAPPVASRGQEPLQRINAAAFPLAVRRVVLDAGHGGGDPGATHQQLAEKDVTLDIGRRLRSRLESTGFEVVQTRTEDRMVPLRERAHIANASRADIFVSIHVNAITKHTNSYGVETYYLGPTSDPSLTQLAAAENVGSGYSMSDLRKLLDGVYADARRDESQQLASTVQQFLHSRLAAYDPSIENWGVKRAPFVVLVATEMPAVLAEVGCLSNRREAAMLDRPEYRQKIADALFDGILAYASVKDAPVKKGT